ncbi:MAG: GAF domain-containing protein [Shinella sp.]|uniref:GAF domain-containing protein n=1 Tax=Shinella sp. TaxID=1870904 RepID=UPI0040350AEF
MEANIAEEISSRSYSSDPESYPVSGSKPINRTRWFDAIHVERQSFVANTIADIATVFPDHEQIWSLGCGSVVNLPIFIADDFMGTMNILHEEHFYTSERVKLVTDVLSIPAKLAFLASPRI